MEIVSQFLKSSTASAQNSALGYAILRPLKKDGYSENTTLPVLRTPSSFAKK